MSAELDQYTIDDAATKEMRQYIGTNRELWLQEDMHYVGELFKKGEINQLDLIRQYGVLIDLTTGDVLEKSTQQFRDMLHKRSVAYWG